MISSGFIKMFVEISMVWLVYTVCTKSPEPVNNFKTKKDRKKKFYMCLLVVKKNIDLYFAQLYFTKQVL